MLTYTLNDTDGPKYLQLSKLIKADVESGKLKAGDRLPSKRTFARNSGVSTITVQNAYDQLISEGYVTAVEKKGYYVSSFRKPLKTAPVIESTDLPEPDLPDLSGNRMREESFPFSIWSKLLRETLSTDRDKLLSPIRAEGVPELRKAIAGHLSSFRGMSVSPSQIVIGAGTEYLYSLLIQLLGRELVYAIEDPGYGKLSRIYAANAIKYTKVPLDEKGLSAELLDSSGADVAHISPNHHFPTGITMPLERRYELLAWAAAKETRFIIEDDYDSEFRVSKSPVPTMYSLDGSGSVIYMNTFSKSLASTIRISYMVLPETLGDTFRRELSFYASTVPSFEQYTLSRFISEGYFEKHINRMRLYYIRQRQAVIDEILMSPLKDRCTIIENSAGLHFILSINTEKSDETIKSELLKEGIKITSLSDYSSIKDSHKFIINYSNLDMKILRKSLLIISGII